MRKPKFKVGDKVQLTKACVEWLIAWIPEGYTVNGVYKKGEHDSELLALFTAREFAAPLRGTVTKLGWDSDTTPTVYAEFSNAYGTYTGWKDYSDLIKLRTTGKRPTRKAKK